jgi:outer membrane immunogenic protein
MKFQLAAAALLASTAIASAADLPARTYTKAPQPVSPVYNWSGFYVGVMGGYAWSDQVTVGITGIGRATTASSDLNGGFGGGTIGYNWQYSPNWVFGIEAEVAGADISYSEGIPGVYALTDKIDMTGSVTGRLGYAFGPGLLYAKGGWAFANNKISGNIFAVPFSESNLHSGWTIGGGLEYMFAPAWSAKVEYMYADFENKTYFNVLQLGTSLHTIKGGINYHFGGPVVAKY